MINKQAPNMHNNVNCRNLLYSEFSRQRIHKVNLVVMGRSETNHRIN